MSTASMDQHSLAMSRADSFVRPRSSAQSGVSRRGLLGAVGASTAAGAVPSWLPANAAEETPFRASGGARPRRRPNLLVILGDDLGWADLSCYGAPDIRTPNLDRLAAIGVRFTQGYSASSVCSPTRFGLYTGRFPGRLPGGLPEPISERNDTDGIPVDHPTLASLLKDVGYDTALIGKWHCGFLPWFSPTRVGWDEFFGNFSGGIDYFSKVYLDGEYDLYENEVEYQDLRYYTDILTERAVQYVRRDHDRPWLLNLNFTTPHWPWEGPNDRAVSRDVTARTLAGDEQALFHQDGGSLATYRVMVESLDDSVGRVLRALRRTGQLDDTLVLFASDNGGERFSYYWPLSGGKGDLYEGGIRVPMLVSWPAALSRRQVHHAPVYTMDWTATFLDLAGAQPDPDHPLDGTSLAAHLLRGGPAPHRDLFWRMRDQRALRRGPIKYVRTLDGVDHLYDLAADVRDRQTRLAPARTTWPGCAGRGRR